MKKLKPKTQGKNSTSGRIFPPIRKTQEKNSILVKQFLPAPKTQENNLKFENFFKRINFPFGNRLYLPFLSTNIFKIGVFSGKN